MESHRKLRVRVLVGSLHLFRDGYGNVLDGSNRTPAKGHKVKITGPIVVHDGDVVQVMNSRDGSVHGFQLTDTDRNQMRQRLPAWERNYGCLSI